ncbi:odorant receptor 4-like isoform X2 [Rhodnius prolixus]|uniref:Odorant receptor n=1 Tax=Rhodnius prolixus TaxID=13249 RepID=T1HDP0_RHOPR
MIPPSTRLYLLIEMAGFGYRPEHKYPTCMKLYMIFMMITYAINWCIIIVALYYEEDNFNTKAELIHYLLESVIATVKYLNFLLRFKEVRGLMKFVDEVRESCRSDPNNQSFIEESEKSESKALKNCFIVAITVPIIFCTSSSLVYMISGLKKLPFLYWVPFDSQRYFWFALAFQLIIYSTAFKVYLGSFGFNILLVMVITSYMKVLQRLLTTKYGETAKRRSAYILHQNINRLVFLTNEFLSGQFLFEISFSAIKLSLRIFAFIKVFSTRKQDVFVSFGILIFSMSSPVAISIIGEMIKSESEKIFAAAYDNVWYEEKEEKTKKELLLVLKASLRPHSLHYRRLTSFNMETFGELLQASYSYLTMLLQFSEIN